MPTILREGGYRFFFYSDERQEPPHVHVQQGDGVAKVWLANGSIAYSVGFSAAQLRHIRQIVAINGERMMRAWNEYHR